MISKKIIPAVITIALLAFTITPVLANGNGGRPEGLTPGFWKHNIRVALEYPGRYSVPHEGEDRIDYDLILDYAETATGLTGTAALEAALADLTAKGPGSESTRRIMADLFNDAAGYEPYSD